MVLPHPVTTVQPLLHDADELLVAEFIVTILVEDLEDCVDQVVGQLDARSHVHCTRKLIWEIKTAGDRVRSEQWIT